MTMEAASWSGLKLPSKILQEGLKAPVPPLDASAHAYRAFLTKLLEGVHVPGGVREAALSTGSALLQGAQDLVASLNRLLSAASQPSEAQEIVHQILVGSHALYRLRSAAYVLQQVAEIAESHLEPSGGRPEFPRIWRLKDYLTPLEKALEPLELSKQMESDRFAALLVHLDELYDDATLVLQRLSSLASRELTDAKALAPEFLRRLYSDFAKASLEDHLLEDRLVKDHLGGGSGGLSRRPKESAPEGNAMDRGNGLFDLLPELLQILQAR